MHACVGGWCSNADVAVNATHGVSGWCAACFEMKLVENTRVTWRILLRLIFRRRAMATVAGLALRLVMLVSLVGAEYSWLPFWRCPMNRLDQVSLQRALLRTDSCASQPVTGLIGQHLALNHIPYAVAAHLALDHPRKPLVVGLFGTPGIGKSVCLLPPNNTYFCCWPCLLRTSLLPTFCIAYLGIYQCNGKPILTIHFQFFETRLRSALYKNADSSGRGDGVLVFSGVDYMSASHVAEYQLEIFRTIATQVY